MSIEQADRRLAGGGDFLLDVLRCWLREWILLAAILRNKFENRSAPFVRITFEHSGIVLQQGAKGHETRICYEGDPQGSSAALALRRAANGESVAEIALPETDVLRPTVRLPKASRTALKKALYFELARLSPIEPGQLYFDFELHATAPNSREVVAVMRAVRRRTIDAALTTCHVADLHIAAIRLGEDLHPADWRAFPVDRFALLTALWRQWKLVALGGAAVLFFLVFLATVYGRGSDTLSELSAQIEAARAPAAATESLRREIIVQASSQSFLEREKRKPLIVATLARFSRVLPHDTWLTSLQVNGTKIRIQGYSRSASRLLNLIGVAGFRKAQFEAPLIHDTGDEAEHFDLSAELPK